MQRKPVLPNIQPWTPTSEESDDFNAGDKTHEWLKSRTSEELKPYSGSWIAASDCRILASANTHAELMRQLSDISPRIIIEFIREPRSKGIVHIY